MPESKVGDLFKAKEILADDLDAAVAAYLGGKAEGPVPLRSGYAVDVAAAIEAHPQSAAIASNPETAPGALRTAVRTAIILAPAVKA